MLCSLNDGGACDAVFLVMLCFLFCFVSGPMST